MAKSIAPKMYWKNLGQVKFDGKPTVFTRPAEWMNATAVTLYGLRIATKFEEGWKVFDRLDYTWRDVTEEERAQFDSLKVLE